MKTKDHGRSEQELDLTDLEKGVLAHLINLKHAKHPPLNRTNPSRDNLMNPMKTKRYAIVLSDGEQVWFYASGHYWSGHSMILFNSLSDCKDFVKTFGLPEPPSNGINYMTYKFKRIKSSIFKPFINGEPLEHHGNNLSS